MINYKNAIYKGKNEKGLYPCYCPDCGHQLDFNATDDYNACKHCPKENQDYCKKYGKWCGTGIVDTHETGYEQRTVYGTCIKCGCKVQYGG